MPKNPSVTVPDPTPDNKKKKKLSEGFLAKFLTGEIGNENTKKKIPRPEGTLGPRG